MKPYASFLNACSIKRAPRSCSPPSISRSTTPSGVGGIEATRRISAKDPDAHILVLSMHEEPDLAVRALQAGAKGFVTKRCAPFLEPCLATLVAAAGRADHSDPLMGLTSREFEVLRILAEGKTVLQVTSILFLSDKTVSTYQTCILERLGVQNSAELARLAIRRGMIQA